METYQVAILLILTFIAGLWIAASFPRCKHEWTLLHEVEIKRVHATFTNIEKVYTCKKCGKIKTFKY